ncbi:MAG TPA: hypothetical protein VK672_00635 [Solirubrobacteraceae bacterium]|jgi:hypothetical protein|nr:hypothetical protein [Solirubrobacteraceae bacterium]
MFGALHRCKRRGLITVLLSITALGVVFAMLLDVDLPTSGGDPGRAIVAQKERIPCGSATSATIAGVDESVARRIYVAELRGYEVRADIAHIAGSAELLAALGGSNQQAVYAAVHRIVYTPHWHVVRLRVVRNGRVLADVGGPDIIAPVSGALRVKGRGVGSFVMSVQDDLGYTKLVSRFIGVPIDLFRAGSFVMGTLQPPPTSVSNGQSLTVGHSEYKALTLDTRAFPTGALKVVLFVPAPSRALGARDCASVRTAAWGEVATHVAARFTPLSAHYEDFLHTLQGVSGGVVFVRSGSVHVAGGGPSRIPRTGIVKYRGRTWTVFSWEPRPPARIYFLTPASQPGGR